MVDSSNKSARLPPSKVLLVEDDPELPEVLAGLLEADNISLTFAQDAHQAYAKATAEPFDLILLDLGLPEVDGFTLLRRLKESPKTQPTPVIVLTAWNSTSDKLQGFELGAVDYVTKPFEATELRARVRAVLRAKSLQDQLTRTNRDLEAARVAAETAARTKAEFLAKMSHEIRTPMNGVIAMAGLLRETPLTQEQRGYVDTIHASGEALLSIINEILDFSKIESGKLEIESVPFVLRTCVEEAFDVVAAKAAEKKLELAYQLEDGIPQQVLGDMNRLRQVLVNLIANAVKFTQAGEVVLNVRLLSPAGPAQAAKLPAAPAGSASESSRGETGASDLPCWVQFSVRDTGIGIPADRMARLFKSFSQGDASTARHYGGTGLGLVISRSLVEAMGGKMWVESVAQKGSTFHFTLPMRAAPQPPAAPERLPQLAERRLLIVDDNPTNRRILTLQARKWGMIPRELAGSRDALDLLRAGEKFDLAILDLQMPEMDGLTLAQEIRKLPESSNLPLVLLTSMGVRADDPQVAKAGFATCLTKPIKPAQLQETLVRIVGGTKHVAMPKAPGPSKLDPNTAARLPMRVMLCDDNVINQKVALRLLQQMGYQATVVANGVEALKALDAAPYDLVFMDLQMPEMDGLEATRAIRERQQDPAKFPNYAGRTIIVAMTASAMQSDRERCLAAGMDDYLAKPVRPEDIRQVVERWGRTVAAAPPPEAPKPAASEVAAPAASATEEPPVDMPRLMDFSDGNMDNLRDLVSLYLNQTALQMEQLSAAVQAGNAPDVRRVAHSCAGASATCGMHGLAPLLRRMEHLADAGDLADTPHLCAEAQREFQRIQEFLQPYTSADSGAPPVATS